MATRETLAQMLRRKRAERRETQPQAAAELSVSEGTVRAWEKGQMPTWEAGYRLADYLGVTMDGLRKAVELSAKR